MAVSVSRTDDGGYKVLLDGTEVVLPSESKKTQQNNLIKFGTPKKYLQVDVGPYEFSVVSNGSKEVVVAEDEDFDETELDKRGSMYTALESSWSAAEKEIPENPSGGLRLNKKARRTKRNVRNNKRRKSRKLSTRRR